MPLALADSALALMAVFAGNLLAWRQARWAVSEAKSLAHSQARMAKEADQTSQKLSAVSASLLSMKNSMELLARKTEALDFNVGQLTLRMVKEQIRVKGVQVGEETTDQERLTGMRTTLPPIDRTAENAADGFFVDGKPVDPRTGVPRTIAWLATPEEERSPPTLPEFMGIWRCDERTLTGFYLEAGFHRELVLEMRPWLQKVNMVRNMVYKRATHPTAKDAWVWMKRFEAMIVKGVGPEAAFLPDDEEKKNARSRPEERSPEPDEPPDEGFIVVQP